MSSNSSLEVDMDKIIQRLELLEQKVFNTARQSLQIIDNVDKARIMAYNEMLSFARIGFNTLDSFLGIFGFAIPQSIKLVVNTILMSAPALIQLATGEIALGNPAAVGAIMNITTAVVTAMLLQFQGDEAQQELMETQQFIRNVMNLWGRS